MNPSKEHPNWVIPSIADVLCLVFSVFVVCLLLGIYGIVMVFLTTRDKSLLVFRYIMVFLTHGHVTVCLCHKQKPSARPVRA